MISVFDERIFFDTISGHPSYTVNTIIRKLSAYTRVDRARRFKIGITNLPERRFTQSYERKYDEMVVLYKTSSINYVSLLETLLIEHNWELADNKISGGGGHIGQPPYYLYVVIRY